MRLVIGPVLIACTLLLAGCDTASKPKEQVPQSQSQSVGQTKAAAISQGKREDIGLISDNGSKAVLTYAFAGTKAPSAVFTGADGRDVQLSDFAGRPLLVNIWATWCAPCKVEMPTLDALAVLEEGKVSVIAVSQDLEGRVPVQAFFKSTGIENLEPYTDSDNLLLGALGSNISLPTTVLYDSAGKETWRIIGGVEWDDAEVAKLLSEAS
jgi:thiol-disulfide isomerase/thioredoxin